MDYEAESVRTRGRPKKTWSEVTEKDLTDPRTMQDAMDCGKWTKFAKDIV